MEAYILFRGHLPHIVLRTALAPEGIGSPAHDTQIGRLFENLMSTQKKKNSQ